MADTISYPTKNPFPKRLDVSLKEVVSNGTLDDRFITYERGTYIEARKELQDYLVSHSLFQSDSMRALGIKGEHGSGKSHLIRYLIQHVRYYSKSKDIPIQQIVVTAESNDFLALYKHIMSGIDFLTLKSVHTALLGQVAQLQLKDGAVIDKVSEDLKNDPGRITRYIDDDLISISRLEENYIEKLKELTSHPDYESFLQAISYLQNSRLGKEAHRWLCGHKLDSLTAERIGVKRTIDDSKIANLALQFLISLFSLARKPLIIFIDQIERLIRDAEIETRRVNNGILKSLAEHSMSYGTFLCLSGQNQGWDLLSKDFTGRVKLIELHNLTLNESLNLFKAYLATDQDYDNYTTEKEIFPFSEEAIKEILRISNGNVRKTIGLAYKAFDISFEDNAVIEGNTIKSASNYFQEFGYFDKLSVFEHVRTCLLKLNLPFKEKVFVSGWPDGEIDIVIPSSKKPQAILEISDAVFQEEEVSEAIQFINNASLIKKKFPKVSLILIVAGYLSREVMDRLSQVVNAFIVYNPETFTAEFTNIISHLSDDTNYQKPAKPEKQEIPNSQLNELKGYFEDLLKSRTNDVTQLSKRLDALFEDQNFKENDRASDVNYTARKELEELEKNRVTEILAKKQLNAKEEQEHLRSQGEKFRQQLFVRRITPFIALIAAGIVFYIIDFSSLGDDLLSEISKPMSILVISVCVFVIGFLYLKTTRFIDQSIRLSRDSVPSIRVLDQASRSIKRPVESYRYFLFTLRTDPNPQVRYVVAKALLGGYKHLKDREIQEIIDSLKRESWIVSYKTILRLLTKVASQQDFPDHLINEFLVESLPLATNAEAIYIIDTVLTSELNEYFKDKITEGLENRPPYLRLHAIGIRGLRYRRDFEFLLPSTHTFLEKPYELALNFLTHLIKGESTKDDYLTEELVEIFKNRTNYDAGYFKDSIELDAIDVDPSLFQSVSEIFGHGADDTLGDYDDIKEGHLYKELSDFFLQARIYVELKKVSSQG